MLAREQVYTQAHTFLQNMPRLAFTPGKYSMPRGWDLITTSTQRQRVGQHKVLWMAVDDLIRP